MLDCGRDYGNDGDRRGTSSGDGTTRRTRASGETNGEYYIGGSAGHLRGTIGWRLPTLAATTSTIVAAVAPVVAIVIAAAAATAPIILVMAVLPPPPTPTPLLLELRARPISFRDGCVPLTPGGRQVATQALHLVTVSRGYL